MTIMALMRRLLARARKPGPEWRWPMRRWAGREPTISDGFGPEKRKGRGHWGVDLMYRRPAKGAAEYPLRAPWYEMPPESLAHAVGPGMVVRVVHRPNGWAIEVRHGEVLGYRDLVVVYRHLMDPLVVPGDGVLGGTTLGTIDRDRRRDPVALTHLHLEVWDRGRVIRPHAGRYDKRHGTDPTKLLRRLRHWG